MKKLFSVSAELHCPVIVYQAWDVECKMQRFKSLQEVALSEDNIANEIYFELIVIYREYIYNTSFSS